MNTPESIRRENLRILNERGFKPVEWMPLPNRVGQPASESGYSGGTVRPFVEIANRFLCHCAVFAWAAAPDDFEFPISEFVKQNSLREHMTEQELQILDMPKSEAREQLAGSVGWRLENMWSLGWLLGLLEQPSAITGSQMLLDRGQPVSNEEAVKIEDLFYLSHNAVRSGQLGNDSVPAEFDPVGDGGAIHERRHSLTWALSPGTSWDNTDLST